MESHAAVERDAKNERSPLIPPLSGWRGRPWPAILGTLWVLLAILGVWGLYERFAFGHRLAGYTSYIPWGLWVATYVYLVGLSAGTFLVGAGGLLLDVRPLRRLAPVALWTSLTAILAGMATIGLDLGHMSRFWEVFVRPNFASSVMAWEVWMYAAFTLLLVVMLYLVGRDGSQRALRWLAGVGVILAIAFNSGGGALFGVVSARPMWNSGAYPVFFLITAATSGAALLSLISALRRDLEATRLLGGLTLVLLLLDAFLELSEVSIALLAAVPEHVEAYTLYLFGPYWWVFWLVHVGLGVVIPAALLVWNRRSPAVVGTAGFLVATTLIAVRLNVIVPALSVPQLPGLESAYMDARLAFTYAPTAMEWRVLALVVAGATALFWLGYRYLPALRGERSE